MATITDIRAFYSAIRMFNGGMFGGNFLTKEHEVQLEERMLYIGRSICEDWNLPYPLPRERYGELLPVVSHPLGPKASEAFESLKLWAKTTINFEFSFFK